MRIPFTILIKLLIKTCILYTYMVYILYHNIHTYFNKYHNKYNNKRSFYTYTLCSVFDRFFGFLKMYEGQSYLIHIKIIKCT